jgi:hypothetical protein|eukprot:COSAG01_NODE_6557_length_3610_cov_3.296212_4_plen_121_part_00
MPRACAMRLLDDRVWREMRREAHPELVARGLGMHWKTFKKVRVGVLGLSLLLAAWHRPLTPPLVTLLLPGAPTTDPTSRDSCAGTWTTQARPTRSGRGRPPSASWRGTTRRSGAGCWTGR